MAHNNMTSLSSKLKHLQLSLNSKQDQEIGYGLALREAIITADHVTELEALKSLGDLHLQKGKRRNDSTEFDKAAALYDTALRRCADPDHDMRETLEHRQGHMEKLSKQLLYGYNPMHQRLSIKSWFSVNNNVLRVAETFAELDRNIRKYGRSVEETYTEALVLAIGSYDVSLEFEVLKSLGDFYLTNGKKAKDVTQFFKAAGMYNKALTICEGPEAEETIIRRILYTDKIREAVTRKKLRITRTAKVKISHPTDQSSPYQDHLKKGDLYIYDADLDSAELHFATALKFVHVKDSTAQQYQREVKPLCKLGDVYSKRGQQTGDGGDFVKAAALYNAAIARSEDKVLESNLKSAIKEVEKIFLQCSLDIKSNTSQDDKEKHKKQLKEMRDQIKLEMETIDQQLDPYIHDEDDPCVKEIEAKRAQAVRQLFERIAKERRVFISQLVEECIRLMGPPPCTYALIGLGSQATGLVTPYSDLEFAILVENESGQCLEYFRNLTHYLHLKVVNLGETILPALGIKSLNDFYSGNRLDDWYYDSVTPRGFAFDVSMPKASKTPLGREATKQKPSCELISTPESMVSMLQKDVTLHIKEGYHLATILRNPCLIAGDQDLIDTYKAITVKALQADGGKMANQMVQETLKENVKSYDDKETITARMINVKKGLYRFPIIAMDCLALSSGITSTTVWETIDAVKIKKIVSAENAHHLKVLVSISAELRLRTYFANGGQRENLSALVSMETELHGQELSMQMSNDEVPISALKQVFYLPNVKQLLRYYYTSIPLKAFLPTCSEERLVSNFYDTSPRVRAKIHLDLCQYRRAIEYFREALKIAENNQSERINLLTDLAVCWYELGDLKNAISYSEEVLNTIEGRIIYWNNDSRLTIATMLSNLGTACLDYGHHSKAIRYLERALQMKRHIHGANEAHPDNALGLFFLGEAWENMGNLRKANAYQEHAIQICRSIKVEENTHSNATALFSNVGCLWQRRGDNKKAISYFKKALQILRNIYGQSTAHSHIASLLNNLGYAWYEYCDYKKAITCSEEALQMFRSIYGLTHPKIARSLNTLGSAYGALGNHRKAITYHKEAQHVLDTIFGQGTANPDIAGTLEKMGEVFRGLRDYTEAVAYHEKALKMRQVMYSQNECHPGIANSFNNLGVAYSCQGDHKKAIGYFVKALQMYRGIYGQTAKHRYIARCLKNLGRARKGVGDLSKAVSCYEEMLEMFQSIHGPTAEHPDIADSFDDLGIAYVHLADHGKAISYHEQALRMYRGVYGQNTSHPDIARSLSNLASAWYDLGQHREIASMMSFENIHRFAQKMFWHVLGLDIESAQNTLEEPWTGIEDYEKAAFYFEQALQMFRSCYGQDSPHREIDAMLSNLGQTWFKIPGNYGKANSYLEQSLQMKRGIYGQSAVNPDIAMSLFNLGQAKIFLGDHNIAVSILQEGLKMARKLPPEQKSKQFKEAEDSVAMILPYPGNST